MLSSWGEVIVSPSMGHGLRACDFGASSLAFMWREFIVAIGVVAIKVLVVVVVPRNDRRRCCNCLHAVMMQLDVRDDHRPYYCSRGKTSPSLSLL